MFKKLLDGELSLKDTFWKFGVVGLVFVNMLVRIFGSMLAQKLNGITILTYYRTYFNPLKMDSGMVLLTVLYLVSLGILLFYCVTVVLGTWRSSAQYDRSLWLRHLSRFLILVMVFYSVRSLF